MDRNFFNTHSTLGYSAFRMFMSKIDNLESVNSDELKDFLVFIDGEEGVISPEKIKRYRNKANDLENFIRRLRLALEKHELEILSKKQSIGKTISQGTKYSVEEAGVYISQKIRRETAYSRQQVSNWISDYDKEGREGLKSYKQSARKTIIYQSDIDDFIEKNNSFFRN